MKRIITFILIFIVSFASCYETVKCFSTSLGITLCSIEDHCDERNSESKESSEKEENEKSNDDLYFTHNSPSASLKIKGSKFNQKLNFSSSEYSQVVYSPPEIISAA